MTIIMVYVSENSKLLLCRRRDRDRDFAVNLLRTRMGPGRGPGAGLPAAGPVRGAGACARQPARGAASRVLARCAGRVKYGVRQISLRRAKVRPALAMGSKGSQRRRVSLQPQLASGE